jgi:hypothetical protein
MENKEDELRNKINENTGETNLGKWFTEPISERLKDASILVINTKFDKDGNLVEIKTLLDQKPLGEQ